MRPFDPRRDVRRLRECFPYDDRGRRIRIPISAEDWEAVKDAHCDFKPVVVTDVDTGIAHLMMPDGQTGFRHLGSGDVALAAVGVARGES